MSWSIGPLVGFDTETTGVNTRQDRIVTAALVHDDGAGGRRTRTWLINPGVEIPAAASAVHGISTAAARAGGTAPPIALAEISAHIVSALRAGIPIVAFNATFDITILERELERHGLPTVSSQVGIIPVLDPLVIDRGVEKYRRGKRRLADLCTVYGVPVATDLHTAEVDVFAALDVLRAMLTRNPELCAQEVQAVHDWQIGAHRDWATDFNAWRERKGLAGPGPSVHWPLEPGLGDDDA